MPGIVLSPEDKTVISKTVTVPTFTHLQLSGETDLLDSVGNSLVAALWGLGQRS